MFVECQDMKALRFKIKNISTNFNFSKYALCFSDIGFLSKSFGAEAPIGGGGGGIEPVDIGGGGGGGGPGADGAGGAVTKKIFIF